MHQCMQQDIKTLDVNILASPKETIIYSFIRSFIINQVAWSTSEQNTMKHTHTHTSINSQSATDITQN